MEDRLNYDEVIGDVEDYKEFFLGCLGVEVGDGGFVMNLVMEYDCNDNKYVEEDELDKKVDNDDDLIFIIS